uniref:Uncharacterized protein n=1 Tax=Arundo donax TaxID=35708 RepID=A0A0A9HW24_ARUDO
MSSFHNQEKKDSRPTY